MSAAKSHKEASVLQHVGTVPPMDWKARYSPNPGAVLLFKTGRPLPPSRHTVRAFHMCHDGHRGSATRREGEPSPSKTRGTRAVPPCRDEIKWTAAAAESAAKSALLPKKWRVLGASLRAKAGSQSITLRELPPGR